MSSTIASTPPFAHVLCLAPRKRLPVLPAVKQRKYSRFRPLHSAILATDTGPDAPTIEKDSA